MPLTAGLSVLSVVLSDWKQQLGSQQLGLQRKFSADSQAFRPASLAAEAGKQLAAGSLGRTSSRQWGADERECAAITFRVIDSPWGRIDSRAVRESLFGRHLTEVLPCDPNVDYWAFHRRLAPRADRDRDLGDANLLGFSTFSDLAGFSHCQAVQTAGNLCCATHSCAGLCEGCYCPYLPDSASRFC